MAFLPSLQESIGSVTGGVLFFQIKHIQNKSSAEKADANLSIMLHDSLGFGHSWDNNFVLGYSPLLKSGTWETASSSSVNLCEPLSYNLSAASETWKTGSSFVLTSRSPSEKEQREIGTLTIWQSQSKACEIFQSLVLDLQDLLVTGQIWEKRNVLRLEQLYVFRKPTETLQFLEVYPFLIPLLREAYTNIRKHFPTSAAFLEVVADPEAFEEEQLVIFIATDSAPDQATECLDRLDDEWWLDALEYAQGKLCITLEFQ